MLIFYFIWVVWLLSEIFLNKLRRSEKQSGRDFDRKSMRDIWLSIGISIPLAVIASMFLSLPILRGIMLDYLGLALIILGMVLRFAAVITLGRFFTVDLSIQKDHAIKQDGLYKYIRHPSYLGSLLSFLGFGLTLNNWVSLALLMILVPTAVIRRIRLEEAMLQQALGEEYTQYIQKSWRLVPGIY